MHRTAKMVQELARPALRTRGEARLSALESDPCLRGHGVEPGLIVAVEARGSEAAKSAIGEA